ncbi:MAG: nucleotidyltransferase family protein [Candidatus Nealsonbacteria bacterium]
MIQNNLKAVILAGGKGTRLYPITYEIPKPLLPVKKKPIINHLVELFSEQGIKDIFVLINKEFKEEFDWWKKRYYPKNNIKLVEESEPLGTFGGLYYLKKELLGKEFFLTNGDELKKINLKKMKDFHQKKGILATIALVKVPNPQDYGVVICKDGIVQKFLEKPKNPPSKYINSGLYLLSPEIFEYHPGSKFSMIETNLFPKLAKKGELAGFKFNGKWTDCGTWQRYEKAIRTWE